MKRALALAALLAGFASSLLAGSLPLAGRSKPTTEWSQPTEAGVAWDSGIYAYDGSGNIARIGLDAFGYDGAGRLTSGTVNAYGVATTQAFQYDRFGNILQVSTTPDYGGDFPVPPETAELEVNASTNRLNRACHPIRGCETWTYDGATGNVTSSQKSGGSAVFSVTYGWDPAGAMTELEGGNAHERYIYDANDERIITVSLDGDNEVIRRWTWRDASNKVAREAVEQVGVGVWSEARDNVYRNGTLLAAYTSANAAVADRHYHVDHLGTPRLITDAARHKVAIEAYLPFGDRAPGSELPYVGFKDRMRFTGHERDGEGSPYRPSLDYMHARYYTPEWGRFLSRDPGNDWNIHQPQSWNMYSYVRNNPVNARDPDGRFTDPITAAFEAIALPAVVVAAVDTVIVLGIVYAIGYEYVGERPEPVVIPQEILAEHKNGKRPSTRGKHEQGQARRAKDRGGEKGDARRDPPRIRPKGHKGPWPPKFVPIPVPEKEPTPIPAPAPAPVPPPPAPKPKDEKDKHPVTTAWFVPDAVTNGDMSGEKIHCRSSIRRGTQARAPQRGGTRESGIAA